MVPRSKALLLLLFAVGLRLGVLGFVVPRLSRQDVVVAASSVQAAVEQARRATLNALPVFDSLDDELPFPIPFERSLTTYRFERPVHKRLIQAAIDEAGEAGTPQFFHIVDKPLGATSVVGAVGCVSVVRSVQFESYDDQYDEEEAPMLVSVASGGRGVIVEELGTFPYPTASVVPLKDVDEAVDDDYEREAWTRLVSIASLTSTIESRGFAAQDAEESLEQLEEELADFQEKTLEYNWPATERRERAGFLLLALCLLDHEASTEALVTTSGRRRFELLLNFLRSTESELAAKVALEALSFDSSLAVVLLQPGTKFTFFWHQDDGWFDGTIVENMQPTAGWYTVRWDSDGTVTRVLMDDENKSRWKVISQ